ncbi:MAG TPA: sigma-70 family RNA polymerase sigma factor [Candidatus Saccharicenans sp.]|nr:sigma-70 family RNA polymerase sigma factor [Candidatus Saccharicenans sp.]HPU94004.1 sigma-70 family RNA polymerase sigma factor [Candidatus Saccharicenans sp.]
MMKADEEQQLIERARRGEVEAFMQLVREYEHRVFQLAYNLTRNREDAADLAQETFLQAFRAIKSFRGNSSFYTWLHRIAVNLGLNFLKKHRRTSNYLEDLDSLEEKGRGGELAEAGGIPSVEDSWLSEELKINLEKALDELPPAFRATFFLVVQEGMSHKQAAELLGCSENTVSWRIHEARKRLKRRLQPFLSKE